MAKIKLTKIAVESGQPQAKDVELRDTVVPGFLCKVTPTGRREFMLQTAPWREGCPYVLPLPNDSAKHLTFGEHYVHTEDKPVREAAELVARRRQAITGARQPQEAVA